MTDTEVLNNILNDVAPLLRRKKGKFSLSRSEKVAYLYFALPLGAAAMACVGIFFFLPVPQIRWAGWIPIVGLLIRLAGLSMMIGGFLAVWLPIFQSIRRPENVLREAILTPFNEDLDRLIPQLVAKYERHHLEYALERATFGAAQERLGVGLAVGALEKVGRIPLLLGTGLTLWTLSKEQFFASNLHLIGGIIVSLGLVYWHAFTQTQALRRLDHAVLALKHAVEAKKWAESSRNSDTVKLSLSSPPDGERNIAL
jgi:hypothetical protein